MGIVLAGLVAVAVLAGGGEGGGAAPRRLAPVAVIARRVESLRDLRFRRVPVPVAVSPATARREGLEDLDRTYPPARRKVDEEVRELLGLVPAGTDLRAVEASVFGTGVAGYYDPRSKRLRTVTGAATGTRVTAEMVLAHELTHALEDQRFGIVHEAQGSGDAALARLALVEGTATTVMERYVVRYFGAGELFGGLLAGAAQSGPTLPPVLQDQLVFPYTGGAAFVQHLQRRAGGRWTLVDLAERVRPPASTEQILHPEKWIRPDAPERVTMRLAPLLGPGWRRTGAGTWGELQTRELLSAGGAPAADRAAAGWGGDRYELWQRPQSGCAAPCRSADALVMRWRWDTARDAHEFESAMRDAPTTRSTSAVVRRGTTVTLALAPSARLAERLAS
jgi:hypothetical protein